MSDIKIAVATHKDYEMPQDQIYLPIHSGAQLSNIELWFH